MLNAREFPSTCNDLRNEERERLYREISEINHMLVLVGFIFYHLLCQALPSLSPVVPCFEMVGLTVSNTSSGKLKLETKVISQDKGLVVNGVFRLSHRLASSLGHL